MKWVWVGVWGGVGGGGCAQWGGVGWEEDVYQQVNWLQFDFCRQDSLVNFLTNHTAQLNKTFLILRNSSIAAWKPMAGK